MLRALSAIRAVGGLYGITDIEQSQISQGGRNYDLEQVLLGSNACSMDCAGAVSFYVSVGQWATKINELEPGFPHHVALDVILKGFKSALSDAGPNALAFQEAFTERWLKGMSKFDCGLDNVDGDVKFCACLFHYDLAKNGRWQGLVEAAEAYTSIPEYTVHEADFSQFDSNQNGYLEQEDLVGLLSHQLQRPPTQEELDAYLQANDTDSDGRISLEEYVASICGPGPREMVEAVLDAYMGAWVEAFGEIGWGKEVDFAQLYSANEVHKQ